MVVFEKGQSLRSGELHRDVLVQDICADISIFNQGTHLQHSLTKVGVVGRRLLSRTSTVKPFNSKGGSHAETKSVPPSQADSKLALPALINVPIPACSPSVPGLRPPLDTIAVRDLKRKLGLPHRPGIRDNT